MGKILAREQGNNVYYVYQESYRVKIDPKDSGKTRGSGKSKVCTKSTYLVSAEKILNCVQEKQKPVSVRVRHFGLIAAAYQTSQLIELPQILEKYIEGSRAGVPRWIYFFVTIINRLDHATSKNKMSKWLKKTMLPELLGFDPAKLTSKNFWYATDDVISESELQQRRETEQCQDDIFVGIDDTLFTTIEKELFKAIDKIIDISRNVFCYDATNFCTYIEEPNCSELAQTCHSKDSKNYLKHVGLLMIIEKKYGIPLFSQVYQANRHDSKVFSAIVSDLIITLKELCGKDSNLIIVLDRGNNSKKNFTSMSGEISWVGALVTSHYDDLIDKELTEYQGKWKEMSFYRCKRRVMELDCVLVLTFNSATKRKQEHSLKRGIKKLKRDINKKWESYKKIPKVIPAGIKSIKKKSRYGACLKVSVRKGRPHFTQIVGEIEKRKKRFGKSIIFSNMLTAETGFLIDTYKEKNKIEEDFQILKETTLIRFQPIRHWTDTKIRAYAFCCIVSMTLMRVMQWLVKQDSYNMGVKLLKEELIDIEEVVTIYSRNNAERQITQRSSVQNKLWKVFNLEEIEKKLLLH